MRYAIITVAAAPVRKKPNHRTEMVNQLLFGEVVKIIKTKENGKWLKVESLYDGYKGWLTSHLVIDINEAAALANDFVLCADVVNDVKLNGTFYKLPIASRLPYFNKGKGKMGNLNYTFSGNIIVPSLKPSSKIIELNTRKFLNAPYQWGGKTIFGIDCSGFAQTVFKLSGIKIARDAWQQAQQGSKVALLQNAKCGDLAFFDDKDEIVHVGILLSSKKIIHAAGKVRIDEVDETGIINSDTGKRTHKLHSIKRFI